MTLPLIGTFRKLSPDDWTGTEGEYARPPRDWAGFECTCDRCKDPILASYHPPHERPIYPPWWKDGALAWSRRELARCTEAIRLTATSPRTASRAFRLRQAKDSLKWWKRKEAELVAMG